MRAPGTDPNRAAGDPDQDERVARAAWSRLAEPGDDDARRLVAAEGAVAALARVRGGHGHPRWQARLPELDPQRDLAILARFGGRLLIPADGEWPPGLVGLGLEAPFCLSGAGAAAPGADPEPIGRAGRVTGLHALRGTGRDRSG